MSGTPENQRSESVLNAIAPIGTAREIPLTQGKVALVDAEDYDWLSKHKWYAARLSGIFYAVRCLWNNGDGKRVMIMMHREVLCLSRGDGKIIDHKSRDGLDNRKTNLRVTTQSMNMYNRKTPSNNTSGFRNVCWHKIQKKWIVQLRVNGSRIYCGCFSNISDAIITYNSAAIKYYGTDAILI
jgi:hypothetical protein